MTTTIPYRSFVIFAGMRTGSNLLEATLNAVKYVTCFGEAFNPYMMGWPDKTELKGITIEEREADPHRLLEAIQTSPNLNGFRYFFDHDPRVFDTIMDDATCAKIILTRNPLDSYVSTVLARQTNQWKLNERERPINAAIHFNPVEFRETVDANDAFINRIQHRLQTSGQSAFWLNYEDLNDVAVLTGMLHWLGRTDLDQVRPANDQVPQNPRLMSEKVSNFAEMEEELTRIDPFNVHGLPNFESKRGAALSTFTAADAGRGLIHQPILGGPTEAIDDWLRGFPPVAGDFTQRTLRDWKRQRPGHRSFAVLVHPLHRAWAALRWVVEAEGKDNLRRLLRDVQRVDLPNGGKLDDLSPAEQRALMAQFLDFLRRNLNGQTTVGTQGVWASQCEVLAGFSKFAQPDMLLRETTLKRDFRALCDAAEVGDPPVLPERGDLPGFLNDGELRAAARKAYQRDYVMFGFED